MSDEKGNIFDGIENGSSSEQFYAETEINSEPAEPKAPETCTSIPEEEKTVQPDISSAGDYQDIPKVEAQQVDGYPKTDNPQSNGSAYANAHAQFSPYGSRPYNYTAGGNRNPYSNSSPYSAQQTYNQPAQPQKPQKSGKGLKVFAAIVSVLLVFALVFSGIMVYKSYGGKKAQTPLATKPTAVNGAQNAPSLDIASSPASVEGALTTAEIAAKVKPSIVGIVVNTRNSGSAAGEGTGVIWSEDKTGTYTYIITCAHVISDSGIMVKVQTEDGTMYDAEIVGFDSRTDLGVVRIKATGLPAAEFGDSDLLRVGDSVFAIGNPGGVEFFGSFTGGFVSAIDRPVSSDIGYTMKCIQHDAAINPGNSGGALVNVYGQVVGINSQKIAATEYEGMGFAIPMTSAKDVIEELVQYGYVPNRPKLGISYYPVSASTQYSMIAQIQGLPAGTLIIDEIDKESSLADTEARRYDMIIAVNGKELTTADVLLELIDNGKVGDKMTLTLCRVNSNYTVTKFDVEITLVEDKSGSMVEETEPEYVDPFEYFNPYGY